MNDAGHQGSPYDSAVNKAVREDDIQLPVSVFLELHISHVALSAV